MTTLPTTMPFDGVEKATPKSDIDVPLLISLSVAGVSAKQNNGLAKRHKAISTGVRKLRILNRPREGSGRLERGVAAQDAAFIE